ncbi:hypothetical protein D3C81_1358420 [compost metagenome]
MSTDLIFTTGYAGYVEVQAFSLFNQTTQNIFQHFGVIRMDNHADWRLAILERWRLRNQHFAGFDVGCGAAA